MQRLMKVQLGTEMTYFKLRLQAAKKTPDALTGDQKPTARLSDSGSSV